jgi:transcriptional regulator with XRE-family HTH domain
VTGEDLRKLRERRGLERQELAEAINASLGTDYSADTVGRWERGREPAKKVTAFLEELAVSEFAGELGLEPDDRPLEDLPPDAGGDTPPGPGPSAAIAQPPITSGRGAYVRACEELWEMIATGVGMMGAATGNMALVNDGAIIAQDKAALGAAWGKLAETNETFRRMLVGMTEGGAWLQVALVTGTTFSKCWQGHVAYTAHARQQAAPPAQEVPADGQVDRDHLREAG